MFPSSDNSLRTIVRRGIDAAIDFATLGEYGWATALDDLGDPTAFVPRPSSEPLLALAPPVVGTAALPRDRKPRTMASQAAASLAPTSAAARARSNAERRSVSICSGTPVRRLPVMRPGVQTTHGANPAVAATGQRKTRSRSGEAPIHEQLCLLG
jgi:hypothetical protein